MRSSSSQDIQPESLHTLQLSTSRSVWYNTIKPLPNGNLMGLKFIENETGSGPPEVFISSFNAKGEKGIEIHSNWSKRIKDIIVDGDKIYFTDFANNIYRRLLSSEKNELIARGGHKGNLHYSHSLLHYPNSHSLISIHEYGMYGAKKNRFVLWDLKNFTEIDTIELEDKIDFLSTTYAFMNPTQLVIASCPSQISQAHAKQDAVHFYKLDLPSHVITKLFERSNISFSSLTIFPENYITWTERNDDSKTSKLIGKHLEKPGFRTFLAATDDKFKKPKKFTFFKKREEGHIHSHLFLPDGSYAVALSKGKILFYSHDNQLIYRTKIDYTSRYNTGFFQLIWNPYREVVMVYNDSQITEIDLNFKKSYQEIMHRHLPADLTHLTLTYLNFFAPLNYKNEKKIYTEINRLKHQCK